MTFQPLNPSTERSHQLIASCQGLVRSIAWNIHQRVRNVIELDDLIGYGQVGLVEAAQKFEEAYDVQFSTYAYHRIRGAIFDGLSEHNWFKPADYYRGRYERLSEQYAELSQIDDCASLEDGVDWLGSTTRSLAVVNFFCQHIDFTKSLSDDSKMTAEETAEYHELADLLKRLVEQLPEDMRQLIDAVYFRELSLTDASKELGWSKSWASRLHSKSLDKLSLLMRNSIAASNSL